ncbi:hypothetical protein PsunGV_gp072 [Pseudalatia unipuncta granulovirus]|uniref:Uncharacterized protein n=1 Tax=Pseudalatia unipuncta granulosis virus TaxID=36355 RepID=B6S6U1_GVPU|nr:hypothetical protein PsunGV_gp072 [Pseudalatia unipuncta granulovirus]ACH69422.1 unknown [Pseudalatia unipuncta granulovirus]
MLATTLAYLCFASLSAASSELPLQSNIEAYSLQTNRLCVNDCVDGACVVNANGTTANCRVGGRLTKRYRTVYNHECVSNCGVFFNDDHDSYCMVQSGSWERCNRDLGVYAKEIALTTNVYDGCLGKCKRLANGRAWCHVAGGSWQYCVPGAQELLISYRTDVGTVCRSPCKIDADASTHCYDNFGAWRKCTLNPRFNDYLEHVNAVVAGAIGEFDEHGYRKCNVGRARRQIDYNDLYFGGDYTKEPGGNMAPYYDPAIWESDGKGNYFYRHNKPTVDVYAPHKRVKRDMVLDFIEMQNIIEQQYQPPGSLDVLRVARLYELNNPTVTTHSLPIISYTLLPMDARFGDTVRYVPLVLRGLINKTTLKFDIHRLPHSQLMHNTTGSMRYQHLSRQLFEYLDVGVERYAEVIVVNVYNSTLAQTAIGVRIRLYENDQLMDIHGNPLVSVADNELDNMYFTTLSESPMC